MLQASRPAAEQLVKDIPELCVEDCVDDWVNSAVDIAEPCNHRNEGGTYVTGAAQHLGDVDSEEGRPAGQKHPWNTQTHNISHRKEGKPSAFSLFPLKPEGWFTFDTSCCEAGAEDFKLLPQRSCSIFTEATDQQKSSLCEEEASCREVCPQRETAGSWLNFTFTMPHRVVFWKTNTYKKLSMINYFKQARLSADLGLGLGISESFGMNKASAAALLLLHVWSSHIVIKFTITTSQRI